MKDLKLQKLYSNLISSMLKDKALQSYFSILFRDVTSTLDLNYINILFYLVDLQCILDYIPD